MKLASVPSCERALLAPNCVLTMTPIDPAKLVTNAIMKKSRNMTAMTKTLLFSCFTVSIFVWVFEWCMG